MLLFYILMFSFVLLMTSRWEIPSACPADSVEHSPRSVHSHTKRSHRGSSAFVNFSSLSILLCCIWILFSFILCFHIISLCVVFLPDFNAFSFRLSSPFVLSFICFSAFVCLFLFFNSRSNAPNSSVHLLRKPAVRAQNFCCSCY